MSDRGYFFLISCVSSILAIVFLMGCVGLGVELTDGRVKLLVILGCVWFACFIGWLDAECDHRNGR